MPAPIALQLYSLREAAAQDFPAVLRQVAEIGYVGVEFAGLHNHAPAEIRTMLDDLGLVACSNHGGLPTAENLSEVLDTAQALGYKYQVTGWGPPQFASVEEIQKIAALGQKGAELLAPSGLKLAMHNHYWEFEAVFDGRYGEDLFMEAAPSMFAQLDTYWIKVGGANPPDVVARYGARAPLLHIKDGPGIKGQDMTAVGKGIMDWPATLAGAQAEWLIVELDSCATDMLEAVRDSYDYLVGEGLATGRR